MTTYTLPEFAIAMNSRGHNVSPQTLRNRFLKLSPPQFKKNKSGRYSIRTADENEFLNLTFLLSDESDWQE